MRVSKHFMVQMTSYKQQFIPWLLPTYMYFEYV